MFMNLGFIMPSSNTVMEEELGKFITVHSTRIPRGNVDGESLIHDVEDERKSPAISSNSASLWNALKCIHEKDTKEKIYRGRLLEEYI